LAALAKPRECRNARLAHCADAPPRAQGARAHSSCSRLLMDVHISRRLSLEETLFSVPDLISKSSLPDIARGKCGELCTVKFFESLILGDLGTVTKYVQSEPHAPQALSFHARVVADLSMCLRVPLEAVIFEQMDPWKEQCMSILISFSEAFLRGTTHVDAVRTLVSKVYDRRSDLYAAGCSLENAEDAAMILCQANTRKVRIYLACDFAEMVGADLLSTASKNPSLTSSLRSAVLQNGALHTSPAALSSNEHSPRRRLLSQAAVWNDSVESHNPRTGPSDLQVMSPSDDEEDLRQKDGDDYAANEKRTPDTFERRGRSMQSDDYSEMYIDVPLQTCAVLPVTKDEEPHTQSYKDPAPADSRIDRFGLADGVYSIIGTPKSRATKWQEQYSSPSSLPLFPTHFGPNAVTAADDRGCDYVRTEKCLNLWPPISRTNLGLEDNEDFDTGSGTSTPPVWRPPGVPRVLTVSRPTSRSSPCDYSSRTPSASEDDRLSPGGCEMPPTPPFLISKATLMLLTLQNEMERAAKEQERKCERAGERERELAHQAENAHYTEFAFENSRAAQGLVHKDPAEWYVASSCAIDDKGRERQRDRNATVTANAAGVGGQVGYRSAGGGGSSISAYDGQIMSAHPHTPNFKADRTTNDILFFSRRTSGDGSCGPVSSFDRKESSGEHQAKGTTSNLFDFARYSAPTSMFFNRTFGDTDCGTQTYHSPRDHSSRGSLADAARGRTCDPYNAVQQHKRATGSVACDAFAASSTKFSSSSSFSDYAIPARPQSSATNETQSGSTTNRGAIEDALRSSALQRAKIRQLQEEISSRLSWRVS
jgi:hypothetical protein